VDTICVSFFFTDAATTVLYTLSLHDALPISLCPPCRICHRGARQWRHVRRNHASRHKGAAIFLRLMARPPSPHEVAHYARHYERSEEHTSELQSRENLVCRLLLEKKKKTKDI